MSQQTPSTPSNKKDNTRTKNGKKKSQNQGQGGKNQSLKTSGNTVAYNYLPKNPIKRIYASANAYATEKKANIADWFRNTPQEVKGVVIGNTINFIIALSTVGTLFLTLVLGSFSVWQAYIANESLKASRDSVLVAKQALDEARKSGEELGRQNEQILKKYERIAGASEIQAVGVGKSVQVNEATARSGQRAAQAAERSSQIAQQTLITSTQAIVGAEAEIQGDFIAGEQVKVKVVFRNRGNSDAVVEGTYNIALTTDLSKLPYGDGVKSIGPIRILPNTERMATLSTAVLTKAQVEGIKAKSLFFIIYSVKLNYTTIGGERPLPFCNVWRQDAGMLGECIDLINDAKK